MELSKFCSATGKLAWVVVAMLLLMLAVQRGIAAETTESREPAPAAQDAAEELKQLRMEVERLRTENAQLRKENQQLRRMLAELVDTPGAKPAIVATGGANTNQTNAVKAAPSPSGDAGRAYWLSNSGKRHNSNCRYFKKTDGQPCGPTEGSACKLCGG